MDSAQHIVKLGPSAVELVDRTMIELARANPAFRPVIEQALIGAPAAILLVEFSGDDRAPLLRQLQGLVELMGDLGLPGSVVEMPDETPQKALWEVRKAGLNIMMSLKGDGKPVSFIEDCAVPLEHLADYTDGLTEVFARHGTRGTWYAHASVGTLHVRPILDMRRSGPDGGASRMRAIAEEASALVRRYKGAYSGEHGDGLCRGEWVRVAVRPGTQRCAASDQAAPRPGQSAESGQDRRYAEDGRRLVVPLRAGLPDDCADTRVRLVGVERAERCRHRTDHAHPAAAATTPAASPRRSRCATTTGIAANSTPAPCARATASPATSST